jgi:mono/diheme cytochrome c family protein
LLVEKNYSGATGALKKLAASGENALGRLHALWTLEGMRRLDAPTVAAALKDPHPRVRATAVRVSEFLIHHGRTDEILPDLLAVALDTDPHIRLQVALTLSEVGSPQSDTAIAGLLRDVADDYTRDAAITGVRGRSLELLERLLADEGAWRSSSPARARTLGALARAVRTEAQPRRVARLLDLAASQTGSLNWRKQALLEGAARVRRQRPILFPEKPAALASLLSEPTLPAARELAESFVWPGKPGYVPPPPPVPLTSEQQARWSRGRKVFDATCIQCHKADGQGQVGLAPPLVDSAWILGPEERLVRIVLNGIRGPLTFGGISFNSDMPGLGTLTDDEVASVLTYVRREWDHAAAPIDPETVSRIRSELRGRSEAWTEQELLQLPIPAERSKNAPGRMPSLQPRM